MDYIAAWQRDGGGRAAMKATATAHTSGALVHTHRNCLYQEHKASIMNDLRRSKAMVEHRQKVLGAGRSLGVELKANDATQRLAARLVVRNEHERQIRILMAKARAVNAMMKKYPHSTSNGAQEETGTRYQQHVEHQKRCFKTLQNTVNRAAVHRAQGNETNANAAAWRRQVGWKSRFNPKFADVLHEGSESEDSDDSEEESSDEDSHEDDSDDEDSNDEEE